MKKLNHFIYGNAADSLFSKEQAAIAEKENILYSGFSAQQVEEVAKAIGYNFDGVHKPQTAHDLYSLSYAEFVVPLVKAVQEQQAMIAALQKPVAATKTESSVLAEKQQTIIIQLQQQVLLLEKRLAALETKQ